MKQLKQIYTSIKALDGNKKFIIILSLTLALFAAAGHTYVFVKKMQVSTTK